MGTDGGDAVWDEWGRLTRFLESTRIAYDREVESLSSVCGASVKVKGSGVYKVDLAEHLEVMTDTEMLFASVLIHTYALAESAAAAHLRVPLRELMGIEEWGADLLEAAGSSWDQVDGGITGAVEAAVARNAAAHGTPTLDALAVRRLRRAGSEGHTIGDVVTLDYPTLQRHRTHLRLLLGAGGIKRSAPPSAVPAT